MMEPMETETTTRRYTPNTEKRCPRCGGTWPVRDSRGELLPKEQLHFDLIKAARYRGGYRLRAICKACHSAEAARRYTPRSHEDSATRLYLSNAEAAQLAGVSASSIARAKRAGDLPHELTAGAVEDWAAARRGAVTEDTKR
jgi:hypothetical protein